MAGTPDAGIRLEVPQHLQSSLKALEAVSYALKQKNLNMRRNVWFDDSVLDLVDPTDPDPQWKKICPAQAAQVRAKALQKSRAAEELTSDDLDSMLGQPSP